MADEPRADIKAESSPQEARPTSEQKKPEPKAEVSETGQKSVSSKPDAEGSELPENSSDRTREQFDKLDAEKQELKEKLARYESNEPVLGNWAAPPVTPGTTSSTVDKFYNKDTGEIDVQALKSFEDRLTKAETEVAATRQESLKSSDEAQEREAFKAHPDLKGNKDFRRRARAILTDSIVNPQDYDNKTLSLKEAADLVNIPSKKDIKQAEKAGADKALEGLSEKEQASLEASGRSDRRQETRPLKDLQRGTRDGDIDSIVERIKNIPSA